MKMNTKWCSVGLVGSLLYGCGLNSKNSDEPGDTDKKGSLKNFMLSVDYENVSTNLSPANYGMQFPNNTMNESEIQNGLNEMNRNIAEVLSNLVTKLCKSSKQPKLLTFEFPSDLVTPPGPTHLNS